MTKICTDRSAVVVTTVVADAVSVPGGTTGVDAETPPTLVNDGMAALKFYQEVFGMPMRKSSPTVNILTLNANCFFGIEASKEKDPAVDHFALGIQNFKAEELEFQTKASSSVIRTEYWSN